MKAGIDWAGNILGRPIPYALEGLAQQLNVLMNLKLDILNLSMLPSTLVIRYRPFKSIWRLLHIDRFEEGKYDLYPEPIKYPEWLEEGIDEVQNQIGKYLRTLKDRDDVDPYQHDRAFWDYSIGDRPPDRLAGNPHRGAGDFGR